MRQIRSRSFIYDALFVVVIMAAAMVSAVVETAAVLGAFPVIAGASMERPTPARATPAAAGGSSVDGALLTAAASRIGR